MGRREGSLFHLSVVVVRVGVQGQLAHLNEGVLGLGPGLRVGGGWVGGSGKRWVQVCVNEWEKD